MSVFSCLSGKCSVPSQACQKLVDSYTFIFHKHLFCSFRFYFCGWACAWTFNVVSSTFMHSTDAKSEKKQNPYFLYFYRFADLNLWLSLLLLPIFSSDVQCIRALLLRDFSLKIFVHNVHLENRVVYGDNSVQST